MANLGDILTLGGKIVRAIGEIEGLDDPGDTGQIPVIRLRIGRKKFLLGPIPIKVVE